MADAIPSLHFPASSGTDGDTFWLFCGCGESWVANRIIERLHPQPNLDVGVSGCISRLSFHFKKHMRTGEDGY